MYCFDEFYKIIQIYNDFWYNIAIRTTHLLMIGFIPLPFVGYLATDTIRKTLNSAGYEDDSVEFSKTTYAKAQQYIDYVGKSGNAMDLLGRSWVVKRLEGSQEY